MEFSTYSHIDVESPASGDPELASLRHGHASLSAQVSNCLLTLSDHIRNAASMLSRFRESVFGVFRRLPQRFCAFEPGKRPNRLIWLHAMKLTRTLLKRGTALNEARVVDALDRAVATVTPKETLPPCRHDITKNSSVRQKLASAACAYRKRIEISCDIDMGRCLIQV